jgi:hypothetical protein
MTKEIVTINGVTVKVVADPEEESACTRCAFFCKCPSVRDEEAAGITDCVTGDHYYEEVAEGDTV